MLCQREFSFIFGTPATICVTSGVRHVSEVGSNELKRTKTRFFRPARRRMTVFGDGLDMNCSNCRSHTHHPATSRCLRASTLLERAIEVASRLAAAAIECNHGPVRLISLGFMHRTAMASPPRTCNRSWPTQRDARPSPASERSLLWHGGSRLTCRGELAR